MAREPLDVEIKDAGAKRLLADVIDRMKHPKPALAVVGEIVTESIQRNFEKGGRPQKWKPLAPATIKERRRLGKWPGRILVRQGTAGGLFGSISHRPMNDRVVWHANKVYAAIHHFGGMAGRGRKVRIPARPYMMIQDEDWAEIRDAMNRFIVRGKA